MDRQQATQIAALINSRNRLVTTYDANSIMKRSGNFLSEIQAGVVVACVELKKVQWYQWEIQHLSVAQEHERRGYGMLMLQRAEEHARRGRAMILQCTIREGNEASERLFKRALYRKGLSFHNPRSGNNVSVWQKAVSVNH
jgi:GNAT superfamily N-acetyltransferase